MKKTSIVLAMMLVGGSLVAGIEEKSQPREQKSPRRCCLGRGDTKTPFAAAYTGSHIVRRLQVNGQITDGPSQLIIIDSAAIKRSGANSVAQILSQSGTHR